MKHVNVMSIYHTILQNIFLTSHFEDMLPETLLILKAKMIFFLPMFKN